METPKLWTKNFLLTGIVNFFILLTYYQITAILAVHAMENLNASPSEAGLVTGILIVAALISRIITGKFIEQLGRKKTLLIGFAFILLAMLLYFGPKNLPFLFVVRCLHGIGFGVSTTATMTIVAHIVPQTRRGEGIGYYMLSTTLASAIGPSLGIAVYQHASFYTNLIITGIISIVSCFIALLLTAPEADLSEKQKANLKSFALSNFFEVNVLPIALIGFLVFFSYSSIIGFFSAYAKSINLIDVGSLFFIIYSGATLVSRPFISRWFDRKGENFVMYPSFIIFAIGLAILGQAHEGVSLLSAGALLGIGFGTFVASAQAIAVKLVQSHRVGVASSTFLAISETGIGIGPFILGIFIPIIGFRGLYFSLTGLVLLSMYLYFILHGKKAATLQRN